MMATVAVGWAGYVRKPEWVGVVYLNTDSTHALSLHGRRLNFGFEVLTSDKANQPTALVERLDDLLVVCRRQAKILVGHDLAPDLARLSAFAADRRLPGVDAVYQQWTDRATKGRGMARMFDTAHDLGLPETVTLAAACGHADLTAATVDDPDASPTGTVRHAISRTLAIALVAARATGKYEWTGPIDVDQLVADAAWDHLAQLGDEPCDPSGVAAS